MTILPGWRRAFRMPLGKRTLERDVDDELAFHLAMREEKLQRLGIAPDIAESQARARFGDQSKVRDECLTIDRQYAREVRTMEWLESVWSDFRYALRTLRRMPAFTTVATVTLALGIGATSAMFTLVNSILLRPLPYPNADRLVRLIQSYPEKKLDTWGVSQENLVMYRDGATDFEYFAGYRQNTSTLRAEGGSLRILIALVTADFFKVLGVNPAMGRGIAKEEDVPGRNTVVVISHGLWQTRFGGDASILGKTIDVDGQPCQIIGVMPQDFAFPNAGTKMWRPMGLDPTRTHAWINAGLGRLKPGISVQHAERQTTAIMWGWARRRADVIGAPSSAPEKTKMKTIVTPLHEAVTGRTARPLTVLMAAVSLILLIATANVATLLSSRAAARQREIGLRTALGASSGRVLRQLLTESVALALLGAVAGIALAVTAVRAFTHSSLVSLPRIGEVGVDGRVLAVTLAVSVLSGILFGLLPALHGVRTQSSSDLNAGQRESSHRSARRVNNALVVAQLSLSVVLLVAAGLVLKSFQRLTHIDMGFRAEGVTSIALPLPERYNSATTLTPFVSTLLDQVRAIPGVRSASLAWSLPFEGGSNYDGYLIDGRPVPPAGNEDQTYQTAVSQGFFSTLGIQMLYGRDFTAADDTTGLSVAVVNDVIAKRYWSGTGALGKRIRVTGDDTWFTIVGVVASARDQDVAADPRPHIYVSLPQSGGNRLSLAVRTTSDPATVIPGVRRAIASVEPMIPLDGVRLLSGVVDQSLDTRRLTEILLGAFALLAVALAGVGIYGVMSLHVANRNREFGIRLAIGAEPRALVRLVLGEGFVLAMAGVGLGIVGAIIATRWIGSLLYDVSPTDPIVFVSLPLALASIAVASCYLPARRAAKSDPMQVLRAD
jgi:putative ABC transport system permease protein